MAKVTLSDLAPDEAIHFSGWQVDFDLGGSGKSSLDTTDRSVLRFAEEHPWLNVEYDDPVVVAPSPLNTLAEHPELDALSGQGPHAGDPFDPAKVKEVEDAKVVDLGQRVALDLSLDQGDKVVVGEIKGDDVSVDGVAVTLAADEEHDPAKSPKGFHPTEKQAQAAAESANDDTKDDA